MKTIACYVYACASCAYLAGNALLQVGEFGVARKSLLYHHLDVHSAPSTPQNEADVVLIGNEAHHNWSGFGGWLDCTVAW